MPRSGANDVELLSNIACGLPPPGGLERLAHPFCNGQLFGTRSALDRAELCFIKEHLEPFTHAMSISDSRYESTRLHWIERQPVATSIVPWNVTPGWIAFETGQSFSAFSSMRWARSRSFSAPTAMRTSRATPVIR
jgi:hypothetical protein